MGKENAKGAYLITGGSSGLGEACVRRFIDKGRMVAILDVSEDGQKFADLHPDQAIFVNTDVTSEESVQNAIKKAKAKFGKILGVVNCAGVGASQKTASPSRGPFDLEVFKRVVNINLTGTFNVCRLVAQAMLEQEPDENAAFEGQVGQVAYAGSKGGVVSMTLVMARDLAPYGVRCVTIAPGIFDTPMMALLPESGRKSLTSQVPFPKRFGQPEEFAQLALSIISNPMINGTTIRLDGALRMSAL